MENKNIIAVIGATIAASLCCVTPVLAVLAGSTSMVSSFSWLAPYHNYLVVFTVLVLIYAWYDKLKPSKDIECCTNEGFFNTKKFLFIITVFVAIMLSFPQWGNKVFEGAPTAESCDTGTCETPIASKSEKTQVVKKVQKPLPFIATDTKNKACDTGTSCPTPKPNTTPQTTKIDNLPVLKYMSDEAAHPTPYKQVACSGTGNKNLDTLMAQKRAEVEEMAPPVLLKMLDEDEDIILVDIREPKQKDGFTISAMESYSMTYGQVYFTAFKNLQSRDNVVVVYGKFGMVSLFVASTLKKLGYKHVYSLKGGTDAWQLAGYPYERIEE